ncbi:glycoside hydrolase [Acephala macrosclerotiorum]|nr:glycoside hydrolase [Acephala macrosclerotiorum]
MARLRQDCLLPLALFQDDMYHTSPCIPQPALKIHIQTPLLTLTTSLTLTHASKSLLLALPISYNNWARFECALNESLFTTTAINIGDCWPLHSRSLNGSLQWDPIKFPEGSIWLGEFLRDKGFKFGIYNAGTFRSWGIDYLKLDGCYVDPSTEPRYKEIYGHWHDVLSAMEQQLIFSESAPAYFSGKNNLTDWYTVMDWVSTYGELDKHSDDITTFDSPDPCSSLSVPEAWLYFNDPNFLIVDHANLALEEKKSLFALWASFGAPLIISAWIPGLSEEKIEYLTNEELNRVDQDGLGLQATLVSQDGTWDVLTRSLSNGDRLLTALNRGAGEGMLTVPMMRVGYADSEGQEFQVKHL